RRTVAAPAHAIARGPQLPVPATTPPSANLVLHRDTYLLLITLKGGIARQREPSRQPGNTWPADLDGARGNRGCRYPRPAGPGEQPAAWTGRSPSPSPSTKGTRGQRGPRPGSGHRQIVGAAAGWKLDRAGAATDRRPGRPGSERTCQRSCRRSDQ